MLAVYHFDFQNDERAPQNKALARELKEQRDVFLFQCNIGCRAFSRYREIDKEIKTNVVKWITESDKIIFPLDAEKTLTSKKVQWEKMK